MKRCVFLTILLVLAAGSSWTHAQLNPPKEYQGTIDLSDVTDAFVKNLKLLRTRIPEEGIRDQIDAVIGQAEDLGSFFRAKGTASKRRQLFEEQEELRFKKGISKRDQEKLRELEEKIKELDPENKFGNGRTLYNETQSELLKQLDLLQTSDPVLKDIIRLIRQHLNVYNKALKEY